MMHEERRRNAEEDGSVLDAMTSGVEELKIPDTTTSNFAFKQKKGAKKKKAAPKAQFLYDV